MHIRCIAHVVNLVVQALLHDLDEANDPDQDDYFESSKDQPQHYDAESDEDQIALEQEEFDDVMDPEEEILLDNEEKMVATQSPLKRVSNIALYCTVDFTSVLQLRFITTKIVSSPQRRAKFRRIAQANYGSQPTKKHLEHLMVIRDVRTRWNYTHAMIRRAQLLKEVSIASSFHISSCILTSILLGC